MRLGHSMGLMVKGLFLFALAGCQFDGRQMVAAMSDAINKSGTVEGLGNDQPISDDLIADEGRGAESAVDDPQNEGAPDSEKSPLEEAVAEVGGASAAGNPAAQGGPAKPPWNSPYEVYGDRYVVKDTSRGYLEVGIASWYGKKFQGRKTSNGETFDMYRSSAAHKTLPIPSMIRVTNLDNGRKIDVRVNDRGPFHDDRILDLSFAAAKALGFSDQGTAPVVIEALDALNYPGESAAPKKVPNIYLQAGAFQSIGSAEKLKRDIETTFMLQRLNATVRVLESELEDEIKLHKVWIGPIVNTNREATISKILSQMGLSKPVKVVAN